ncbi:hypothetical protein ACFP67_14205 [Mammaliicoccus sciuri]|uniref:hypothetical protein n=1 Tax=Mammaliicoccus sciuri TaxID=1296 RepID=UPI000CD1E3EF|nr:hypothetical protein [Mammaliicoccus sciuri]PNZ29981.1 hypothetical protein CD114_01115 [Mammaliicoccus sciuri]
MITEQERQAFKKRMKDMNDEIRENAKNEGIEIKSSIHDRWQYDDELYKKHENKSSKRPRGLSNSSNNRTTRKSVRHVQVQQVSSISPILRHALGLRNGLNTLTGANKRTSRQTTRPRINKQRTTNKK